MSLIPIPFEAASGEDSDGGSRKKSFRPGMESKARVRDEKLLRQLCVKLGDFISRGSLTTIEQIDDLIIRLQKSILGLQRKKKELLEQRHSNNKKYKKSWFPWS